MINNIINMFEFDILAFEGDSCGTRYTGVVAGVDFADAVNRLSGEYDITTINRMVMIESTYGGIYEFNNEYSNFTVTEKECDIYD